MERLFEWRRRPAHEMREMRLICILKYATASSRRRIIKIRVKRKIYKSITNERFQLKVSEGDPKGASLRRHHNLRNELT